MSRLPTEQHNMKSLEGLEGWGKLKKKLGLNKLHTRDAIKAVNKAVVAVVAPTKSNLKSAEVAVKPYVAPVLAVASVALPVVGSAASAAWQLQRAQSAKKRMKKEAAIFAIEERKALDAEQAEQKAEQEKTAMAYVQQMAASSSGGGGGGGGSLSYSTPPAANGTPTAEQAPAAAPEKNNVLAWAAGGLLALKAISLVI